MHLFSKLLASAVLASATALSSSAQPEPSHTRLGAEKSYATFNAARDALLLDDTVAEFRDEPRLVYTEAAYGQDAHYEQESYQGPRTNVALEQGHSYRDIDRTIRINKGIRSAKITGRNVEVGTLDGRVTLRGWVNTAADKDRIGEIAIAASRLELVDNQIVIGKPVALN
jgi:osmotically-inducible protein OsmY